ncbi:MAG TPA: hypothetical protein VEF04_23270 [Blastocatellia bacterium]|nr:hypothetical protein [Blastocatellia bacterium]
MLLVLACLDGALITYLFSKEISLKARLSSSAVIGTMLIAWPGFILALLIGLSRINVGIVAIILIGLFIANYKYAKNLIADLRTIKFNLLDLSIFGLWAAFFMWLFSRVVVIEPDGLHTAPANNYGDLPFHFSVITSFSDGANFPPQSPIYAGLRFTYPFLIDFLTAFFHVAGAAWPMAFFMTNIVLALALVALIEIMTFELTGNQLAARLAPLLFIFNGGFGFVYAIRDYLNSNVGLLEFLKHLPRTYTMSDDLHLRWGNVVTTLLVPQRSLLFGLPIVAMVITLWHRGVNGGWNEGEVKSTENQNSPSPIPQSLSPFLAAGLLTGFLPLMHAHGFLALMMASVVLALIFWSWNWLWFFVPAGVLAAPQALWLSGTGVKSSLFKLHLGWEANDLSPIYFWALNAGAFIALLIIALLIKKLLPNRSRLFYAPFVLWFIVPNVVLLAPWAWDNIKMLIYWYLVSCAFVALLLAKLFANRIIVLRAVGAVALIVVIFSGALDVLRGLSSVEYTLLFGRPELEVAELIKQRTPQRAVILHAPIHNSVITLTGRQSFMGYPGHLWTHGIDYKEREEQVEMIYRSPQESDKLLKQNQIDYIVVGPAEREKYFPGNEEQWIFASYPVVIEHEGYRVYQIRSSQ